MQLWQQNMMFKQLQRQQQLQQLGEARQPNSLNQHSVTAEQAAGGQIPLLINGTPVREDQQMFMNLMQRGASPSMQGFANRQAFSQDQNQTMHSMGLVPQQHDASLHGTPIGSAGGNMSQYSNVQGMARDSVNFWTHSRGNQSPKPIMQSLPFGNSFQGDHATVPSDNVGMNQGAYFSKQQMKNVFGQVPLQDENILQMNASLPEFSESQEQAGNHEVLQQNTKQLGSSQGLVPLDPLEQKILFNMDDDGWDTGFGRSLDIGAGGFGSALESSDSSAALQSGSWSALMLSAVAEASSCDTGVQEKWSGLTFQNTEVSTDNRPSTIINEERQRTGWVDNNVQSASPNSKSFPMFRDSIMKSNFPGFHQPGIQSSNEQGERLRQYNSDESFQKSTRNAREWLDCNAQQKISNQTSQHIQPLMHSENARAGQNYEHSESDAHQRRMDSPNNFSQLSNTEEGGDNGALDKGRVPSSYPWNGRLEQPNSHTDNLMREDSQANHFDSVPHPVTTKVGQEYGKNTLDKPDSMKHVHGSMSNNKNESAGNTQKQRRSSSHNVKNSFEGLTYESFNDSSSPKQGHVGQFNLVGNTKISKHAMNLDKLPNFQGNTKAPDDGGYGRVVESSTSTTFGQTDRSNCQNVAPEISGSQHMLDLLHKVDISREDSPMAHFGSVDRNSSEMPKADTHDSYLGHMFDQSSTSQGFGLKLAPPSQRLPNVSRFHPSQDSVQVDSNLNPSQVNSDIGLSKQGWLDSTSSVKSFPPNEFPQRRPHWDNKTTNLGQTNVSSFLNKQVNSAATLTSSPSYGRSQPQVQNMPKAPVVSESLQATQSGTSIRFAPFGPASSQDTSELTHTNPVQPYPVLETASVSQSSVMPGMPQKGGMSSTYQNAWKNVPTSRLPSAGSFIDPSKVSTENTSWSSQGLNDQNFLKGRIVSSDLDPNSVNPQSFEYGEDRLGKQRSRQDMSSDNPDSLQSGGQSEGEEPFAKHVKAHSNHQDPDRVVHVDNNTSATSERNLESFGRSLKASQTLHQNHTLQAMKGANETDPTQSSAKKYNEADGVINVQQLIGASQHQPMHEHNPKFGNHSHVGPNSSQLNSFPSGDDRMPNFLTNAREELSGKSGSQPALQSLQDIGPYDQNKSNNRYSDAVYNHTDHSQINLRMAPTWVNQYGTVRNGLMPPTYDARGVETVIEQYSLGKPSQILPIDTSVGQIGSPASGQVGSTSPSPMVVGKNFSGSYVLPSGLINQSGTNLRAKRRKTMKSELIPWHKEVTQGLLHRLQDISTAEQDWAQVTNRLIEKVEDDIELIREEQSMHHQSRRRLILTTQLIQQLLRPAPASILLGDASSRCDSVAYYIARLALGDACSLSSCSTNELHSASGNSDMSSERHKAFQSDKRFAKVMEGFTDRAKKLETDFLRLENSSIIDIRVECQELERNSVMNRFAKFHMRRQPDRSGTSCSGTAMSPSKPPPQRYVAAFPMPRHLPEGFQCLSL